MPAGGPTGPRLDPGESRAILDGLGAELDRLIASLGDEVRRVAREAGPDLTTEQAAQARTMIDVCEELRRLSAEFLRDAAPRPEGDAPPQAADGP